MNRSAAVPLSAPVNQCAGIGLPLHRVKCLSGSAQTPGSKDEALPLCTLA
ncbi:hypothetical protein K7472_14680 [Streptomyces sp. PTM05]|uniref:Uncharacterized protein n=1 Tax=Streptantibioticus parmotrematis TaxID=2873249 RepID=A0ABS7QUP5_9ACTN|nr:hypothetical protein [Streptantibioticus parmotrematis]MBY8886095.1 hypothetical protein [Streptantibioticus parmotrematis]